LVEHRDVTIPNWTLTCWQFNNVLKGVNHCHHHAKLDHSKCRICVKPFKVMQVLVYKHYKTAKQVHDHQHDPNCLLLGLDFLVFNRIACNFNICRSNID
jgi:hypothetical protein